MSRVIVTRDSAPHTSFQRVRPYELTVEDGGHVDHRARLGETQALDLLHSLAEILGELDAAPPRASAGWHWVVRLNAHPRNNDEQWHPYELWIAGGLRRFAMMNNAEAVDLRASLERALGELAILAEDRDEDLIDEALARAAAMATAEGLLDETAVNAEAFDAWWRGYYCGTGDLSAATATQVVCAVAPELAGDSAADALERVAEMERGNATRTELARCALGLATRAVLADIRRHEPGGSTETREDALRLAEAALRFIVRAEATPHDA